MDEDKCAQCGTPAAPGAKFCESCGAPLAAAPQPVEGPAAIAQPVQGPAAAEPAAAYAAPLAQAPYSAPGVEMHYQGVAIRFVALLVDAIILGIVSYILIFLFAASAITVDTSTGAVSFGPAYYAAVVLGIVIELLYFTLLLGRYGQSVGMMVVKIKVVSEADSGPITYGAAFIRTILLYIDEIPYAIPFLLGAILIWTSDKKQRLGDRVAHTVVLKA
ncbi:MAG: RDD family protein [Halobacteriota archaeon]